MSNRRGVVLLLVLTSLALAAAVITPLAGLSADAALAANYQADALRHWMAGDSLLAAFAALRSRDSTLDRELDRRGFAVIELEFAGVQVRARVEEDSAKLPLALLGTEPRRRAAALQRLGSLQGLSTAPGATAPDVVRCFDDLFDTASDRELFGTIDRPGWAQFLTPLGARVNVRRTPAAILEAALADLKPGSGTQLARLRDLDPEASVQQYLASLELTEAQRRKAAERLDTKTSRYSALLETTIAGDRRWRYVVWAADTSDRVLVDWEVAP